jgi:hypothetical protein
VNGQIHVPAVLTPGERGRITDCWPILKSENSWSYSHSKSKPPHDRPTRKQWLCRLCYIKTNVFLFVCREQRTQRAVDRVQVVIPAQSTACGLHDRPVRHVSLSAFFTWRQVSVSTELKPSPEAVSVGLLNLSTPPSINSEVCLLCFASPYAPLCVLIMMCLLTRSVLVYNDCKNKLTISVTFKECRLLGCYPVWLL